MPQPKPQALKQRLLDSVRSKTGPSPILRAMMPETNPKKKKRKLVSPETAKKFRDGFNS